MASDAGAGDSSTGGAGFGDDIVGDNGGVRDNGGAGDVGQSAGSTGAPPVCPRHLDRVSYVRCQRCNKPTCPECQRPASVGIQCVDCVNEAKRNQRPLRSRLGFTAAQGPPVVTYVLIGLNVAAYLYGMYVLGRGVWFSDWALLSGYSDSFFGLGTEPYRWVSSGFTHDGIFHIGMNMFALWQLGQILERLLGRARFLAIYALSLLGGSLAVVVLGASAVGASGAIFGLLAAYGVVLRKLSLPYTNVLVIAAIFIGGPLLSNFLPASIGFFSSISWQGHLGGAVVGAITMLAMLRGVDKREKARLSGG